MPDVSHDLVVTRTIDVSIGTAVRLCVPRATAEGWLPELWRDARPHLRNERLLAAAADGNACRLVYEAIRAGRLGAGHWLATFTGGNAVEILWEDLCEPQ